jgi:hypothetical protein
VLEPASQIRWDAGEGRGHHGVGEGMPWRTPGLREDARRGGVPLDPWERREEDAMAIAVVIFFKEWRQRLRLGTCGREATSHMRTGAVCRCGQVKGCNRTDQLYEIK